MNIYKFTIAIICIFLVVKPYAQTTFDLNQYYLPNLKTSSLVTNFTLHGAEELNHSSFGGNFRIQYSSYYRNPKKQSNYHISWNTRPSFSSQRQENSSKLSSWNNSLQLFITNKHYFFKNPKIFIETDATTNINSYSSKQVAPPKKDILVKKKQINTSIPLMIGWGRIENISEAWRALRIYDSFDKLQMLSSAPSKDQILGLANEMAIQRKTRYLDFRNGKIEQLKAIDKYLASTRLIKNQNIEYFTTLNDNWMYGINETRLSGSTVSIGYTPSISNIRDSIQYGSYGILKYERHKAINQLWQLDLHVKLGFGTNYNQKFNKTDQNTISSASIKGSFYPNSRTTISSQLSTNLIYKKTFGIQHQVYIAYYLSPKTRIQFNTNLNLVKSYLHSSKLFTSFTYGVKLNYFIW